MEHNLLAQVSCIIARVLLARMGEAVRTQFPALRRTAAQPLLVILRHDDFRTADRASQTPVSRGIFWTRLRHPSSSYHWKRKPN
jgi:hypothetical protein